MRKMLASSSKKMPYVRDIEGGHSRMLSQVPEGAAACKSHRIKLFTLVPKGGAGVSDARPSGARALGRLSRRVAVKRARYARWAKVLRSKKELRSVKNCKGGGIPPLTNRRERKSGPPDRERVVKGLTLPRNEREGYSGKYVAHQSGQSTMINDRLAEKVQSGEPEGSWGGGGY